MNWLKRLLAASRASARRIGGPVGIAGMTRHELRDIGLQDRPPERHQPRDSRGERISGGSPFPW